jgi:hypothetical protein
MKRVLPIILNEHEVLPPDLRSNISQKCLKPGDYLDERTMKNVNIECSISRNFVICIGYLVFLA